MIRTEKEDSLRNLPTLGKKPINKKQPRNRKLRNNFYQFGNKIQIVLVAMRMSRDKRLRLVFLRLNSATYFVEETGLCEDAN